MSNLERKEPGLPTRTAMEDEAEYGGLVAETTNTSKSLREQASSWIGGLAGRLAEEQNTPAAAKTKQRLKIRPISKKEAERMRGRARIIIEPDRPKNPELVEEMIKRERRKHT